VKVTKNARTVEFHQQRGSRSDLFRQRGRCKVDHKTAVAACHYQRPSEQPVMRRHYCMTLEHRYSRASLGHSRETSHLVELDSLHTPAALARYSPSGCRWAALAAFGSQGSKRGGPRPRKQVASHRAVRYEHRVPKWNNLGGQDAEVSACLCAPLGSHREA